ncbi:hypothetical protein ACJJV6_13215 [Arthrobacter nitrophenolicus]|uniref:hypothetical protein n=1 Tax=Arthrobacter nitrophenolicus TaxID=683150 RepID=UPI00389ACAAB
MKVGEIFGGMHEDPRGTTVIVNGAEFLHAEAHQYSSLLAEKLDRLIARPPQGGASLVLAGRDLDVDKLLVGESNGAHRIQFGSRGQTNTDQYMLGDLRDAFIPEGTAIYESTAGSQSTYFSPFIGSDGRSLEDGLLELPIGIGGANFSTAWAQNLVVCGGSWSARSRVIAGMAQVAQESGVHTWVATAVPDSALSANWRHHRGRLATGVVQARELLRLVCDRVFPRIDACRTLNTTNVRDVRIPVDLALPLAIFIDDLDALTGDSTNLPEVLEAAKAVETLLDFLAKTASQTNVTLVIGSAATLATISAHRALWNSAAQLQLGSSTPIPGSDEAALYFPAPGLPAVTLEKAEVQ